MVVPVPSEPYKRHDRWTEAINTISFTTLQSIHMEQTNKTTLPAKTSDRRVLAISQLTQYGVNIKNGVTKSRTGHQLDS